MLINIAMIPFQWKCCKYWYTLASGGETSQLDSLILILFTQLLEVIVDIITKQNQKVHTYREQHNG
jgi:hypothetical protein